MTPDQAGAVTAMRSVLVEAGDALACGSLDRLLASEPALFAAVERLAGAGELPLDETGRAAVEQARAALLRCRRLGASLMEFTRISLDPRNAHAYSRGGLIPAGESPSGPGRAPGAMLEARG